MTTDDLSGDGRRHEHEEELTSEYMFGLLDYETWNIYLGARRIGQVTINATDRSAEFTAGDDFSPAYTWMTRSGIRNWRNWLMKHEQPRGTYKQAF